MISMHRRQGFVLSILILLPLSCSSEHDKTQKSEAERGYIWETQPDAMQKFQAVEDIILDSAQERRRQTEDQAQ